MPTITTPYRVCPIGAHVDHQHGVVTGFALDRGVTLIYEPAENHRLAAVTPWESIEEEYAASFEGSSQATQPNQPGWRSVRSSSKNGMVFRMRVWWKISG